MTMPPFEPPPPVPPDPYAPPPREPDEAPPTDAPPVPPHPPGVGPLDEVDEAVLLGDVDEVNLDE